MTSIRKNLLRWLIWGQLLAVTLTGTVTFFYVRSELEGLFDDRLKQLAHSIPTSSAAIEVTAPTLKNVDFDDDDDFEIQIWSADGKLLQRINPQETSPALSEIGYSSHWSHGMYWRSFVLKRGDRLIQTSQPYSDRLELSTDVAIGAIAPVCVLILVLGGLVWVSVGRGLRPLTDLARDLNQREPESLRPLKAEGLPQEVLPVVNALNRLLGKLEAAIESQRNFVNDAAHELRTPLAAVQLQAQLLQRAASAEDRTQALGEIRAGTARASHLVQQLLTLARMEPGNSYRLIETVDLSILMKTVVAEHADVAAQKQLDLGVCQDEALTLQGNYDGLRIMLRNLIDNAIRYSPPGGRVDVSLTKTDSKAKLEVLDSGPGIPAAERELVLRRFYRHPGNQETGSGLGLPIVQEVVSRHGGELVLGEGDGGQGLRVIVSFPLTLPRPQLA